MNEARSSISSKSDDCHRQDACATASHRENEQISKPRHEQWLLIAATVLLLFASWWNNATASLRILFVWLLALAVLGRWGQQRLSDLQRAVLAALIGLGVIHLVVLPTAGQPMAAVAAKTVFLLMSLLSLGRQTFGREHPFAKWNRCVAAGIAVSALLGLLHAFNILIVANTLAATVVIFMPLAYVLIFGLLASHYRNPKQQQILVRLLLVVPVIIPLLAMTQFLFLGIIKQRADRSLQRDDLESALRWNTTSLAINGRLRIGVAEDRLLLQRARILDGLDRPTGALEVLLRRCHLLYPAAEDPTLRLLSDTYLTTTPLESQIVMLSRPTALFYFDKLPLPKNLLERSLLLGLFVRYGLFDRLLIEYAQGGLGEGFDFGYLRRSLDMLPPGGDKNNETWVKYFRGICEARLGRRDAAVANFRQVETRWPQYHNARVWLQRLGAGTDRSVNNPATGPSVGRIENAQMLGNHRGGLSVDDALWTALEMRPGRYGFEFEVRGLAAEGEWPILQVYLDGTLVLEEPVRAQTWTTVKWEADFDDDACHRLVVGFPNDILKKVGDRIINRNLYLRQIRIAKIGRDKAGARE